MCPHSNQPITNESYVTTRGAAGRPPFTRHRIWSKISRLLACVAGVLGLASTVVGEAPIFSWTAKGGGPNADFARSIAVDGGGNVLLVGSYYESANFGGASLAASINKYSAYLVKCNVQGSPVWGRSVVSPDWHSIYGVAVAAGNSGDVYITGYGEGAPSVFVSKYDSGGEFIWTREESGHRTASYGLGVVASPDGGAYVAGYFGNSPNTSVTFGTNTLTSAGNTDAFLVKYDSNGNAVWARRAGGLAGAYASSVAVDNEGNALITGTFSDIATFGSVILIGSAIPNTFVAKCDSQGNFLWATRLSSGQVLSDIGNGRNNTIATDARGNVYVGGGYYTTSFPGSGFIAKLDPSGTVVWNKPVAGAVSSIAADSLGNIFFGGSFDGSIALDGQSVATAGGIDTFVYKLAPNGTAIWAKRAGFVFDDIGNGLAVDAAGNAFLTGTFHDTTQFDTNIISGNGDDIFVAKLGNNTVQLAPAIVAQPQNQIVSPGATATFGVTANGAPPLRFQWRFNGTNIPGATNALLQVTNALLANVGSYDVLVSNNAGAVFSSTASLTVVPGTPNFADSFASRGILIGFTNFVTGNNAAFTRESGEPDHAGRKGAHSAWLTWTAPDNGNCEMDTFSSSFDTVLAVYTGSTLSNLTLIAANDDASSEVLQSRVAFNAVAGAAYQIAVDGYSAADAGNITFRLSFSNAAPIIAVQPQNRSVVQGSNATFTVTALGFPPLAYQWRFNGTEIPGATNASLDIGDAQSANEGTYSVVVANGFGVATSETATLTVWRSPVIASSPQSQIVIEGTNVTLTVTAEGTMPLTCQWQHDGVNLAGASESTLLLNNLLTNDSGSYVVVVSNAFGSVTSTPAILDVRKPPPLVKTLALISVTGTAWKYLDDGSNQGTAWTEAAFDDAAWPSGPGLFGTESNPSVYPYPFNTAWPVGGGRVTYYARTHFTLPMISLVQDLVFTNYVDDGCIIYLNGIEVGRYNMPDGAVSHMTLAYNSSVEGAPVVGTTATNVLVGGDNVLAVEVHQNSTPSSDVVFGMSLHATVLDLHMPLNVQILGEGSLRRSPDQQFYNIGEQVTLTGVPGRWHAFTRWSDGALENPRTIVIGQSNAYTAVFTPTQALETVTYSGVSRTAPVGMPAILVNNSFVTSGSVTNFDSAQVRITSSFSEGVILFTVNGSSPGFDSIFYDDEFSVRQTVTLRAIAYNSDFTEAVESDPVDLIIVRTHSVNLTTAGGGIVTASPPGARHVAGSSVTLSAEPAPGWRFLQWLGDVSGTNPTAMVSLNRDLCAEAVFGTTSTSAVVGNGTVILNPPTPDLPFGTIQTLTAVPGPGSYFALWGGAGGGTNNPLRISITNAEPAVTAVFQPLPANQYSFTAISDGFGTVTNRPRGNRFASGTTITLTAVPDAGQTFVGWSGDASGSQNPLTVTLSFSKVITAQFTKRPTLTVQSCAEPSVADGFSFLISGEFGARYGIEKSQDGQSWLPLATLTNLFGVTQFNDTSATNSDLRMYRAAPVAP